MKKKRFSSWIGRKIAEDLQKEVNKDALGIKYLYSKELIMLNMKLKMKWWQYYLFLNISCYPYCCCCVLRVTQRFCFFHSEVNVSIFCNKLELNKS